MHHAEVRVRLSPPFKGATRTSSLPTNALASQNPRFDVLAAFKQWGTVFPGAACVVALVDRFAQHCHKVDIDAESWRDLHPFERDDSPGTTTSRTTKKR